ncbi:Uncharacterised protein [Clostridioides difficile]|nr:Uncharacterised protein [Clostridioides difficile]
MHQVPSTSDPGYATALVRVKTGAGLRPGSQRAPASGIGPLYDGSTRIVRTASAHSASAGSAAVPA